MPPPTPLGERIVDGIEQAAAFAYAISPYRWAASLLAVSAIAVVAGLAIISGPRGRTRRQVAARVALTAALVSFPTFVASLAYEAGMHRAPLASSAVGRTGTMRLQMARASDTPLRYPFGDLHRTYGRYSVDPVPSLLAGLTTTMATAATLAAYRGRASYDGVAWLAMATLLGLLTMPLVILLFLVPVVATGLVLPPPPPLPGGWRTFAADLLAAAIAISLLVVAGSRGATLAVPIGEAILLGLVVGPAVRSFLASAGNRTQRLRLLWPLCVLWLALPSPSLAVLLIGTVGVRLVLYQMSEAPPCDDRFGLFAPPTASGHRSETAAAETDNGAA